MADNKDAYVHTQSDKLSESVTDLDKSILDYADIVNQQLREPVTNIFASLPLLADSINSMDTEKAIDTLHSVYHKSYQMLKYINNVSLGARLMGKREFAKEAVDFSSLVQSTFESAKQVLPDYFTLDLYVENGCVVYGNNSLLTAMLFNILLNSFDYRREDDVAVAVSLKKSGKKWILSYKDNSIGMKPEISQNVFSPYFSSNPYNDGEPANKMGLGLYIAKSAAEHAKGTMLLQTEFGKGVNIVVSFDDNDNCTDAIKSKAKDFMLNKYSAMFVTLCDYCTLPDLI